MHITPGITIIEIIFLVCAVVFILFPMVVVVIALLLDKIIEWKESKMAFSELGKLLELIEDIVEIMERTSGMPNNVARGDLSNIGRKIFELKQKEEFK